MPARSAGTPAHLVSAPRRRRGGAGWTARRRTRRMPGSSRSGSPWPCRAWRGRLVRRMKPWSAAVHGGLRDVAERDVAVDLRFPRQAQHALADDVALDLIGAAADRREERVQGEEVGVVAEG